MMFVDSGVIADRAYGAVLMIPIRKDVKTAAGEDYSLLMGLELMETSSRVRWTWE